MRFGVTVLISEFDYEAVADELGAKCMALASRTATSACNMPGPTIWHTYPASSSNSRPWSEMRRLAGKSRIDLHTSAASQRWKAQLAQTGNNGDPEHHPA